MDLDIIRRDKNGSVRFGLVAAAVLLASLAGAKVAKCVVEPKRVESLIAHATAWNEQDPNRIQPYLEGMREVADALKEKNLFIKAPPPKHPVQQVDGILGHEVLIANKWYKAGDKIGEAKVVSVESTQVTIEWNGNTKTFAPLASTDKGGASGPPRPTRKPKSQRKPEPSKSKPETKAAPMVVTEGSGEVDELAWMGINLPPAIRAKIMERWSTMSDEEKAEAKKEWNNMPEDQKEQALRSIDEME